MCALPSRPRPQQDHDGSPSAGRPAYCAVGAEREVTASDTSAAAPHMRPSHMPDARIVCSNLSFSWPDDTPMFQDLSFAIGDGRTGLVAPNGGGKSTLLKLIAGEYRLDRGTVSVEGTVGYLPQSLPLTG